MSKNGNKNLFIGSKTDVAQAGKSFVAAAKSGKTILAKKSTTTKTDKKGIDSQEVIQKLLKTYDSKGAEYPAEHNVGHEYFAKPTLSSFYKSLDPTNSFNPGIGKTSKKKYWK